MKTLTNILLILLTGCCAHYCPTEPVAKLHGTGFMVVNNTTSLINVIQDGQTVAQRLEPGQVLPLRPIWLRTSCVVAVGYTPGGDFIGSDSYTFQSTIRETWVVSRLIRPENPTTWHY